MQLKSRQTLQHDTAEDAVLQQATLIVNFFFPDFGCYDTRLTIFFFLVFAITPRFMALTTPASNPALSYRHNISVPLIPIADTGSKGELLGKQAVQSEISTVLADLSQIYRQVQPTRSFLHCFSLPPLRCGVFDVAG
jgi:hypothetical protein